MARPVMPAAEAIDSLKKPLKGRRGAILGGATAAEREAAVDPDFDYAYSDVDIFHPSMESLSINLSILLNAGAAPLEHKDLRILRKWERRGTNGWKTNSIRVVTNQKVEVNLVYKTIDKHPLRTPLEQVQSFDFSMLGVSYDLRTWERRDLGTYFWPDGQDNKYCLFEDREEQWLNAEVGIFTGLRQADRYARYVERGYNLDAAVTPLVQGYRTTGPHYLEQYDKELLLTGDTYLNLAQLIEDHDIDGLRQAYKELNPHAKVESLAAALKDLKP